MDDYLSTLSGIADNINWSVFPKQYQFSPTTTLNNINSLNDEINRLKIKNYELFEQIPVTGQTKTDSSSKKDESEFDIDYLLKNFD